MQEGAKSGAGQGVLSSLRYDPTDMGNLAVITSRQRVCVCMRLCMCTKQPPGSKSNHAHLHSHGGKAHDELAVGLGYMHQVHRLPNILTNSEGQAGIKTQRGQHTQAIRCQADSSSHLRKTNGRRCNTEAQ